MNDASIRHGREPLIRFRDNPLLIAQARRRLRSRQAMPALLITAMLAGCALAFTALAADELETPMRGLTYVYLVAIAFLLYVRGAIRVAGTISEERRSGILEFHRATPTSPWTDALGYLLGTAAREYASAAVLLPFVLVTASLGGISVLVTAGVLVALLMSGLLYHAFALLIGFTGRSARGVTGTVIGVLFTLYLFAIPAQLAGLVMVGHLTPLPAVYSLFDSDLGKEAVKAPISFFGLTLPPILYSLLTQATVFAFLFWGSVRRLHREVAPIFSRAGAFAFFGALVLLLFGGSWGLITGTVSFKELEGFTRASVGVLASGYLFASVTLAGILLISMVPSYLESTRAMRRARKRGLPAAGWLEDGATGWPLVVGFVALITAGLLLFWTGASDRVSPGALTSVETLLALAGVAAFLFFISSVTEYVRLFERKSSRNTAILIVFVVVVLPGLLAGIVGQIADGRLPLYTAAFSPLLHLFSSIGLMGATWATEGLDDQEKLLPPMLFSLAVTLAISSYFQYRIMALRQSLAARIPLEGGGRGKGEEGNREHSGQAGTPNT